MHKIQAYSFKSYSKYYMIGTKFDICIKSEKNMKFNNLIHYYFMAEVNIDEFTIWLRFLLISSMLAKFLVVQRLIAMISINCIVSFSNLKLYIKK